MCVCFAKEPGGCFAKQPFTSRAGLIAPPAECDCVELCGGEREICTTFSNGRNGVERMLAWEFGDLAMPLTRRVTLNESLHLSGPQFPLLQKRIREEDWMNSKDSSSPVHLCL